MIHAGHVPFARALANACEEENAIRIVAERFTQYRRRLHRSVNRSRQLDRIGGDLL
jgi:hypothetical protein